MNQIAYYIILSMFISLMSGCESRQRAEALQKREAALNQKEQQLLLKEKTLDLREQELMAQAQLKDSVRNMDSLQKGDSSQAYNPALVGKWSVKMTCIETSCAGSAVGDVKTEQWEFLYQGLNVIAKAMSGDQIVRVYIGMFAGNTLELVEDRESTPSEPATKMVVRLSIINQTTMKGQREIIRENQCKIVYDLDMQKANL